MTLGRALFDKRDLAGARTELEAVLKGAPDNILASRLLAEALEGLGELPAALEKYRLALRMAPGDRQVAGRIEAIEAKLESVGRAARGGYSGSGDTAFWWTPRPAAPRSPCWSPHSRRQRTRAARPHK
jgi:tetratricopeptide (TPR) repeat protein